MTFDKACQILDCTPADDIEAVRSKYRILARKYHPDSVSQYNVPDWITKEMEHKFIEIQEAFEILKTHFAKIAPPQDNQQNAPASHYCHLCQRTVPTSVIGRRTSSGFLWLGGHPILSILGTLLMNCGNGEILGCPYCGSEKKVEIKPPPAIDPLTKDHCAADTQSPQSGPRPLIDFDIFAIPIRLAKVLADGIVLLSHGIIYVVKKIFCALMFPAYLAGVVVEKEKGMRVTPRVRNHKTEVVKTSRRIRNNHNRKMVSFRCSSCGAILQGYSDKPVRKRACLKCQGDMRYVDYYKNERKKTPVLV